MPRIPFQQLKNKLAEMDEKIYSVSKLTRKIKELLESSFPKIWVEGEISNLKQHSSGHLYFTLKDEGAQISCAMWRFRVGALLFRPQDGMQVIVQGEVQVYEKSGRYQIIVEQMQPSGVGELQMAFEQLKKKLQAEGLFDEAHKKPLPAYPEKIGVVTSPTGAAIRDIISVATRRFPGIELLIYPVRVQGREAGAEIAQAIRDLNEHGEVEVIIAGRGGGSLEDLWAFNEEVVARAIYESRIPVVSAVGHEVDFSIADFVADFRAPTPSAAAELVVKDRMELLGTINYYYDKLQNSLIKFIQQKRQKLETIRQSYAFRKPEDIVYQKMQRIDELQRLILMSTGHNLQLRQQTLQLLERQLGALNPTAILERGYSICYKEGRVIKDVSLLQLKDLVNVRLARGQFSSEVKALE